MSVLAIAAGCVALPAGSLKAPATREATVAGRPLGSVSIASLSGTLLGPKPGLIANNSAGIIANNSGGLIANNGGGLISDRGGAWRVLHVADLTVPAAGAELTVTDLKGNVLTTKPARTDKDGRFRLTGLKAAAGVVLVKATYPSEGRTVSLSAAVAVAATVQGLTIDPATTLVAKKLAERLRAGEVRPEAVSAAALESASREIASAMSERAVVAAAILEPAAAAETYDHMLEESTQLAAAIATTEASAASPSPGARPSPGAGPSPTPAASPTPAPSAQPSTAASAAPSPSPSASAAPPTNGGRVSTFAGTGDSGAANGARAQASFRRPGGLTFGPQGILYVADSDNNMIRRIAADGTVTTLAGSGATGAANAVQPLDASFDYPMGIAVDAAGNLFVADRDNHRIRKIAANGAVTTFAGSGRNDMIDGVGTAAAFNEPTTLVFDKAGTLYVCDSHNHCIRKITPDGKVSIFAGSGEPGEADGVGTAASFRHPTGFCIGGDGNFYAAEEASGHVRKITPQGLVSTLPGTFDYPGGVAVDAAGVVYVAEMGGARVKRITRAGVVEVLAGGLEGFAEGTGAAARFDTPMGLALDALGRLYVADSDNHRIRRIE